MRRLLVTFVVMGLLGCALAYGLTDSEVGQLVLVDQTELPRMLSDRAAFLPDGHVAVGGWLEWPNGPVVAIFPNDLMIMQIGTQAASPRFAVSPDGKALAFWKRVKVGQSDKAELNIVRLDSQMVMPLGEPIAISDTMYLAWAGAAGPIVYATEDSQRGVGVLYALDLSGGKPRKVLELHDGQWGDLQPAPAPGQIIARWVAASSDCYLVNCQPGEYVPPVPAPTAMEQPNGGGKTETLEIDGQGQLILGLSPTEGVVVDRQVRAAKWRPDGKAILYVKDKQVYVVPPNGGEPRLLADVSSQDAGIFLRGCAWSADGVGIAFWGSSGASGRAWRATLGMERITARFMFPKDAPVKADNHVWVVSKFQKDAFGGIIEPVWSTLKAMLVVTRILRTPEGVIAETMNTGNQSGVAERLASTPVPVAEGAGHISIGVSGQAPEVWSKTSTMTFRPGLVGWLEKTKYVGQPQTLTVERQMLRAVGQ